jgi:hypothetical protein
VIEVQQTSTLPDGWDFLVTVRETDSQTEHRVNLAHRDYERLARQRVPAEALVHNAFEFLLEREPKEAILGQFDLGVVSRYFPDFEAEISKRLSA